MSPYYRTGGHWKRTIVLVGREEPDEQGRRLDDQLVGMVDTAPLAERIVNLLNDFYQSREAEL